MKTRSHVSTPSIVAALALGALVTQPLLAQYGSVRSVGLPSLPWENSRIRLTRLSVEPGAALPAAGSQVLVYLTADSEGRMPAEAIWQAAGGAPLQNRGRVRLEAIAIELKDAPQRVTAETPLEALDSSDGVTVSRLIDNPRVVVTKHRYDPIAYGGPLHLHPEDVVVVYLRGGYTWPLSGLWGAAPVRRGDVEVIPANTLHRLANASSDPLELLVVVTK